MYQLNNVKNNAKNIKEPNKTTKKILKFALAIVLCATICSGCSCKESYMPAIDVVRPDDSRLSCEGLHISIIQMRALMENVKVRCKRPHLFSPYPPCTLWVKQDAARNYHIIRDRVAYLNTLQKNQNCQLESILPTDYESSLVEPGMDPYNDSEKCCESLGLNEGQIKGQIFPKADEEFNINSAKRSRNIPVNNENISLGNENYMLPTNSG